MEIQKDIAPPAATPGTPGTSGTPGTPGTPAGSGGVVPDSGEPSKFSVMLAAVEAHRNRVRIALGAALLARVLFEFKFVTLLKSSANLTVQVPYIGVAMLSYLLVLMWLAARTRDRFGFGMALGIGTIEATYLLVMAIMERPFSISSAGPQIVVALAHLPMAYFAIKSATAYPAQDSKQPWIIGFVAALIFLAIPWLAPTIVEMAGL